MVIRIGLLTIITGKEAKRFRELEYPKRDKLAKESKDFIKLMKERKENSDSEQI